MRDACGPSAPGEANPAVSLGSFLAAEIEGLDRPVFFSTDSLKPVARPFLPVLAPTRYPIRRATGFKLSVLKNTGRSRPSISAARNAPSDTAGFASPGAEGPQASRIDCERAGHLDSTDRAQREKN